VVSGDGEPKTRGICELGLRPTDSSFAHFEPADVEAAFEWFGDSVVMRFTVTGRDKSIEETRTRLTYFENHQRAHGFSKWIILNEASGVAIGDSGAGIARMWLD
jgi:RimJ/RimL family protein N-acetyltransferase